MKFQFKIFLMKLEFSFFFIWFYSYFHKTALNIAVEKENFEIANRLLCRQDINPNARSISNHSFIYIVFFL